MSARMKMKSAKQRAKSKKNTTRIGRVKFQHEDTNKTSNPDLSQLRKPVDISVSSLVQITKLLETGGDEVKRILAHECDVVYECRTCRSLFRSLANFISHKRIYCREKFNISLCRNPYNDHILTNETLITHTESVKCINSKQSYDDIRILRSQAPKKVLNKDLTSIVDMLQEKCADNADNKFPTCEEKPSSTNLPNNVVVQQKETHDPIPKQQILLETINSNPTAMYQTVITPNMATAHPVDLMKTQVMEIQNMIGHDTMVLTPDGQALVSTNELSKSDASLKLHSGDNVENSDSMSNQNLVCSVCNAKFATRKTLTFHMKSLHVSYRMCYPCPCCTSTFANTWSVYRHLYKVHRKSNEQVRKLRAQIQAKAFRKETTGAEDIEKENAIGKSTCGLEQQTNNDEQERMEHLELDLELKRCGGCGRRFDRRAALMSHSQICLKRIAVCNDAASKAKRPSKASSPENATYNNDSSSKETSGNSTSASVVRTSRKQKLTAIHVEPLDDLPDLEMISAVEGVTKLEINNETSIRVENVSKISDADWEMLGPIAENEISEDINSSAKSLVPNGEISQSAELENADAIVKSGCNDLTMANFCNGAVDPQVLSNSLPTTSYQELNTVMNTDYGTKNVTCDSSAMPDSPEIIYTSTAKDRTVAISFGSKKRRISIGTDDRETLNDSGRKSEKTESVRNSPVVSLTKFKEPEMADVTMMEDRMATITNLRKLQCLLCRKKFSSMPNLRRHMAIHIGWNRYRCRLCDFKCFIKCDCVAHCNKVHDARNNRAIIASMVLQIEPSQNVCPPEILIDNSNCTDTTSQLEVIDVTTTTTESNFITEDTNDKRNVNVVSNTASDKSVESPVEVVTTDRDESEAGTAKPSNGMTDSGDKEKRIQQESDKESEEEEKLNQMQNPTRHNDSDIRRMVMEVIFGPIDNGSAEDTGISEILPRNKSCGPQNVSQKSNELKQRERIDDQESNSLSANKSDEVRPQRPARNRVKPVNEDFIYDLTELLRTESAIHRAAATAAKKKQHSQQHAFEAQPSGDIKSQESSVIQKLATCKMPSVILFKKDASAFQH